MPPYMQRRGDTLFFRIAVPPDLRALLGSREITKTLRTERKRNAVPKALLMASQMKQLFIKLRDSMGTGNSDDGLRAELIYKMDLSELGLGIHTIEAEPHEIDEAKSLAQTVIESAALARHRFTALPRPPLFPLPTNAPAQPESGPVPTFHQVIDGFLETYDKAKNPSMFDKYKALLKMLREFIGNIPNTSLLQDHINDFFDTVPNLPPNWRQQCEKKNLTIRQLAEREHPKKLSSETFKMHKGRVREFLKYGVLRWQNRGFPTTLTVEGLDYKGTRIGGEEKQRALSQSELTRLFEGPEMELFASDPALAHQFWLPTIGLFTGARVNEICQLNPKTDILKDLSTGIDYFLITIEGDTDDDVKKTVKASKKRPEPLKVPIHKKLIELGLLDYVNRVKATDAKRIFPKWRPIAGRAAGNAELWFREFLAVIGLRDETQYKMITGMHCLRHTIATTGAEQKLLLDSITGHAQPGGKDISTVFVGYVGAPLSAPLEVKAALLNQLDYGLNFFTPKQLAYEAHESNRIAPQPIRTPLMAPTQQQTN